MLWVRGGSKPLPLPLWGFLGGSTRVRDGSKRGFRSPLIRVRGDLNPRFRSPFTRETSDRKTTCFEMTNPK